MKSIQRVAVSVLALSLAGCGTLQGAGDALQNRPRTPYQSPNLAIAEAGHERIRELGYALFSSRMPNCSAFVHNGALIQRPGTARCTPTDNLGLEGDDLDTYLDRTIMVIDGHCDAYLNSLAQLGDTNRWTRSQFNTVANYIGVLMALAGQPAADIGYLNAGSAFFNSSADNLETLVLISASPGKLGPLVRSQHASMRNDLAGVRQGDASLKLSAYSRWLQDYAAQCTPRGIRLLIDAAIDSTAGDSSPAGVATAAGALSAVIALPLDSMAAQAGLRSGWPDLTDAETLGSLLWLIRTDEPLDAEKQAFIASTLGENLHAVTTAALANPAQKARLRQLMLGPNQAQFDELIRFARNRQAMKSDIERARQEARQATDRFAAEQARANGLGSDVTAARDTIRERDQEIERLKARVAELQPPPAEPVQTDSPQL